MIVKNLIIPLSITLMVIIAYVTVFTLIFKKSSEKMKLLPIKIIFFLLIVLEVVKICYLIGKDGGFYPNRYPIVFCSMVMYAIPLFCFKQNRFSDLAKGFCIIPSFLAFIMFAAIQYRFNMNIMQVHSYIYHGCMLAVAIYLLTSKLYKFEFKKFFGQFLAVGIYITIAATISLVIGGAISVFGPSDPYLGFLYNISGFAVGICILLIAVFLAYLTIYGIVELCSKKEKKNYHLEKEKSVETLEDTKNV